MREGRTIYDNLRKFVKFSFGGNLGKVAVMLVTALIKLDAMNTLSSVAGEVVDVGVVVGETVAVGVTSGVAVGVGSEFAENVPLYAK